MNITLDMYQTIAVAVIVLMAGAFLKKRISFLQKFCIPAPVIGGLLFAILTLVLYMTGVAVIDFDDTLKEVCMVFFFTSVGFQANLKVLKSGGKSLIVFLFLVIMLIVMQNFSAIGLANLIGLDSLTGMTTGSIPMVGGHGTAGAFGPVLEDFGVQGATTVCTAAATFGLIAGSLMGGPVGNRLIKKHNLIATIKTEDDSLLVEEEEKHERHFSMYAPAVFQLIIAVGLGTVVSDLLSLTGMTFPIYIGAMIVAAIMRNIGEYTGKITIHMGEINDLGGICLSLFPRYCYDYTQALAACRPCASAYYTSCRSGCSYVHFHIFCCVQHYGQRLRCSCSCGRYLRFWYGRNAKCNGKYAGNLRKIRTVR